MLEITQEYLTNLFDYDAENGELIRKVSEHGKPAGKIGCVTDGRKRVKIEGKRCTIAELVWIYHHGSKPSKAIDYVDGNRLNTRIENLRLLGANKGVTATAERVRYLMDYNPESGVLTYKNKTSKHAVNVRIGDKVGWAKDCLSNYSYWAVEIDSITYRLSHIAWLHYYGELPKGEIRHKNGDNADMSVANMEVV
jgi:hypothetical protein